MSPGRQRGPLDSYQARRDFTHTPEPTGEEPGEADPQPRFVIHEHSARRLHWDLRLERDGVLVSWALPRGVPLEPKVNFIAPHTEDHPLEYLEFSGEIPAGNYGAGTMSIWDHGTYETLKWEPRKIEVALHGERIDARYALFAISREEQPKDWMIHRMDPPADPGAAPMPEHVAPMLARLATLPSDDAPWAYEVKWDGVRALAYSEPGRLRFDARNGGEITERYPELARLGRALGSHRAVLDGEIVSFDASGRPSFAALQSRIHVGSAAAARRLSGAAPVTYVIFDLLWLDGHSLIDRAYGERRATLAVSAVDQRVPVQPEQIEDHVGDRSGAREAPGGGGRANVNTRLERREARAPGGVEADDLAVEDRAVRAQRAAEPRELRVALGDLAPVASIEAQASGLRVGERAHAVPLDLVGPRRIVARERGEAGEHRRDVLGHRRGAGVGRRVHAVDHPVLGLLLPADREQRVARVDSLAVECDLDLARLPLQRLVCAVVPDRHRAGAVVAGRYLARELEVLQRVVLGVRRDEVDLRFERHAARQRPRDEDTVALEAKVPVEAPRRVLVDYKARLRIGFAGFLAGRLRRVREVAPSLVAIEWAALAAWAHDFCVALGLRAAGLARVAFFGAAAPWPESASTLACSAAMRSGTAAGSLGGGAIEISSPATFRSIRASTAARYSSW